MARFEQLFVLLCLCAATGAHGRTLCQHIGNPTGPSNTGLLFTQAAAIGRLLRQYVSTIAEAGKSPLNPTSVFAQAHEAESKANPRSTGLYHNEATIMLQTGDLYPAPRDMVGTHNAEQGSGRAIASGGTFGTSMYAFGPTASSATITERARAVSAVNALPTSPAGIQGGASSRGSTTTVWDVGRLRTGTGNSNDVMTASVGADLLPPESIGISNVGAGPLAVATAGQAVAVANADDPANGGMTRRLARALLLELFRH